MNDNPILSIILITVLLLFSACFSATETAFNSLSRTRLRSMIEQGNARAQKTLDLLDNYDNLLSSILVGNNVVNIAMSSISTLLFVSILPNAGAAVSTLVITVLVLIFGEIAPKSMARENPEGFAMFMTPIMHVLVVILTPINYLFSKWQDLLKRIFKLGKNTTMTQDELSMVVEDLAQEGSIDEDESNLLLNSIAFEKQEVQDVLTPRVDIVAVPVGTSNKKVAKLFTKCGFSRIPVYKTSLDHIVGILFQKDFYTDTGISDKPISKLMREPVFIPHTMRIDEALRLFRQQNTHMAIVTDEYGGTMGIVTMEDILEELVGEIYDEHDQKSELFKLNENGDCLISGTADKDQLERFFDQKLDTESTSASGWVTEQMDRIPEAGDSFEFGDYTITVTAADGNRVQEIKVHRNPPQEEEEEPAKETKKGKDKEKEKEKEKGKEKEKDSEKD